MDNSEIWEDAKAKYVPEPTDSPDAIPFYRAWVAVKAIWGKEFAEKYNGMIHNCLCWSLPECKYEVFIKIVKDYIETAKCETEPPRQHCCSYNWPPKDNIEERAQNIFAEQFRTKFSGKRLNSKFAKEKWETVKEKALQFARENYDAELKEYNDKESKIEKENQERYNKWLDKIHDFANMINEFGDKLR